MTLRLEDFHFDLPEELIAQRPAPQRDESRLLVLNRSDGSVRHARFSEIGRWLPKNALLVVNDARVVPARLWGHRDTGGRIEVVVLDPPPPGAGPGEYESECLTRPTRRLKPGVQIEFGPDFRAEVVRVEPSGRTVLRFFFGRTPGEIFDEFGRMPLPPYIRREAGGGPDDGLDRERYQTVYARTPGAVAAPTAGLHFTPELLDSLRADGVETVSLTLKVGYGTFAPVRERDITRHRLHPERAFVSEEAAEAVNRARAEGRPVTAVGTTSVRTMEFVGRQDGRLRPFEGLADLFIYPGFEFRVVDHLVTNFHLPESTLLMLVSALAGRETILAAYREAVDRGYRFFSYGDAMLIL